MNSLAEVVFIFNIRPDQGTGIKNTYPKQALVYVENNLMFVDYYYKADPALDYPETKIIYLSSDQFDEFSLLRKLSDTTAKEWLHGFI